MTDLDVQIDAERREVFELMVKALKALDQTSLPPGVCYNDKSGVMAGYDHPWEYCRCGNCYIRRLIARAEKVV